MNLTRLKQTPLDSRQLLSFVTVARTRSFTQAGKELFLSQSAVSHAVKALEDEVGHPLLDRVGKKLQITPAGEHLLHYAEKILADMSVARASLDRRTQWGISRLRVGTSGSFGACLLPEILKHFRRDFPEWPVSVKAGDTRECVEWLDQNTVDVGIVIAPSRAEAVEITPLFTDEVLWIVAPDHPWAQSRTAVTDEIASQNFICRDAASYTSRLLERHFARDGIRMKYSMELGALETVKEMVKTGAGITALAEWTVREELAQGSLVAVPLGKRKLKRNWCLLRSLRRTPSLAEEKFAKLSSETTRALASLASSAALMAHMFWLTAALDFELLTGAL